MKKTVKAVLFDIDGTLANTEHRQHLIDKPEPTNDDWLAFFEAAKDDVPFAWCQEMVRAFALAGYKIVFLTARGEMDRAKTEMWLREHVPFAASPYLLLFMRPNRDSRPDYDVKREVFYKDIWPSYDVLTAIEDNAQVVTMFRSIGIPCLQCEGATEEMKARRAKIESVAAAR